MDKRTDTRGTIMDLLVGKEFSNTYITFTKNAVRGNHYHKKTKQIDIVLSGKLLCRSKVGKIVNESVLREGQIMIHEAGEAHAYKAIEPSELLSVCFGVRIGEDYEKDTFRLEEPLL